MSTAAGGTGDDGSGDRRSSHNKGKTKVGAPDKPKKMSTLERAMLHYLQGVHVDAVAAGEEPPFGGRYAPPPPVSSVATPPSSTILGASTNPHSDSVKAKPVSPRHKDD